MMEKFQLLFEQKLNLFAEESLPVVVDDSDKDVFLHNITLSLLGRLFMTKREAFEPL